MTGDSYPLWGRMYSRWNLGHWRHCIFRNMSSFTLFHSDGCAPVHRRQGERLLGLCIPPQTVTVFPQSWYGVPSAMIGVSWWCSPVNATSGIFIIICILGRRGFWKKYCGCKGHCHVHTACGMTAFLAQQDMTVMVWATRSSDMNPIEHVWVK